MASMGGCLNHPGVEAVARCKQCGKPVCRTCLVKGPSGAFCSQECNERHQAFVMRANALDQKTGRPPGWLFKRVKKLITTLIAIIAVLIAAGAASAYFNINIPFLSNIGRVILNKIGLL